MPIVVFREAVLDRYLNHPEGQVGRYLARRGRMIEAAARRQVGVRTGALRASIHMRHFRDSRGQYVKIGSPLNYALLHHEGSRPHMIYPDRSPVLRFARRGTIVFAHAVRHPGTKANRYLTDNLGLVR
jgi:hypothetical protein